MPRHIKDLYPYQAKHIKECLTAIIRGEHALLVSPTGAGKTVMLQVLCRYLYSAQGTGINKIVVLTPQKPILDGFKRAALLNYRYIPIGDNPVLGLGFLAQGLRPLHTRQARSNSLRTILSSRESDCLHLYCHHAISSSNSTNHDAFADVDDCHGVLVVVDEAHHLVVNNSLTRVLGGAIAKGARLLLTTATPYHSKGELDFVQEHNFAVSTRRMSDHMREGYAPTLTSRVNTLSEPYSSTRLDLIADAFLIAHKADSRPKALVVIPTTPGEELAGTTKSHADLLIEACRAHPDGRDLSYLNAVGPDAGGSVSLECSGETYHDVTITCPTGRYKEGTDDAKLSALYCFAPIESSVLSVQLTGRILRKKLASYRPAAYRTKSSQTLFVPPDTDNYHSADVALKWIIRTEDPIGAALLPPLRRLHIRLQALAQDSDATVVSNATELLSDIDQLSSSLIPESVQLDVMALVSSGASRADVIAAHGQDADVTQLFDALLVAQHADSLGDVELRDACARQRSRRPRRPSVSVIDIQFDLLVAQFDDARVDRELCETSLEPEVLVDYYRRWSAKRDVTDVEKVRAILAAWPPSPDSQERHYLLDLRTRYLLWQAGSQDPDHTVDDLALSELRAAQRDVNVLHEIEHIQNVKPVVALQRYVPLLDWVRCHGRVPRRSDGAIFSHLRHRYYSDPKFVTWKNAIDSLSASLEVYS